MRKIEKGVVVALLVAGFAMSGYAGVIAAWNFNTGSSAQAPGWTDFSVGPNNFRAVTFDGDEFLGNGRITLTQDASGSAVVKKRVIVDAIVQEENPLLAAGKNEMNDGFNLDGSQGFVLSGLVENQTYRLQFIGVVRHDTGKAADRNLTMTVGASTVSLFSTPVAIEQNTGGYSEYLTFMADRSGSITVTFGKYATGYKSVSGLIMETVPNSSVQERFPARDHETKTLGLITAGFMAALCVRRGRYLPRADSCGGVSDNDD